MAALDKGSGGGRAWSRELISEHGVPPYSGTRRQDPAAARGGKIWRRRLLLVGGGDAAW